MSAVIWAVSLGFMPGGRLVEQQQRRLVAERAGQLQPALVAVRQVLGQLVLAPAQPDEPEQLARRVRRRPPPRAAGAARRCRWSTMFELELEVHADEHVLERGHVLEQPDVLEGAAHPGRHDVVRAGAAQDAQPGQERRVPGRPDGRDHERARPARRATPGWCRTSPSSPARPAPSASADRPRRAAAGRPTGPIRARPGAAA